MSKKCFLIKLVQYIFFIAEPPKVCQDATKNGPYQVQINGRLVQVYCEVNFDDKWLV